MKKTEKSVTKDHIDRMRLGHTQGSLFQKATRAHAMGKWRWIITKKLSVLPKGTNRSIPSLTPGSQSLEALVVPTPVATPSKNDAAKYLTLDPVGINPLFTGLESPSVSQDFTLPHSNIQWVKGLPNLWRYLCNLFTNLLLKHTFSCSPSFRCYQADSVGPPIHIFTCPHPPLGLFPPSIGQ